MVSLFSSTRYRDQPCSSKLEVLATDRGTEEFVRNYRVPDPPRKGHDQCRTVSTGGRARHDIVGRCDRHMRRGDGYAFFLLYTENDEMHVAQVREIQNPLRWVAESDKVFRFAPGFRSRRVEFAEKFLGGVS